MHACIELSEPAKTVSRSLEQNDNWREHNERKGHQKREKYTARQGKRDGMMGGGTISMHSDEPDSEEMDTMSVDDDDVRETRVCNESRFNNQPRWRVQEALFEFERQGWKGGKPKYRQK
jgi:hypothetical protein